LTIHGGLLIFISTVANKIIFYLMDNSRKIIMALALLSGAGVTLGIPYNI